MEAEHSPPTVDRFEACRESAKRMFLFLSILRELLLLLLTVVRGSTSLEDVHARIQAMHSDPANTTDSAVHVSPSSLTPGNSLLCSVPGPAVDSSILMGSVRILCRAIVQRDVETVSRILEAAPLLAGRRHEGGWYPLHTAVLSGNSETVKLVLALPKADVNCIYESTGAAVDLGSELGTPIKDTNGATPLHYACLVGNADIIRLLVEHGASFKQEDEKKRVPIEYFDVLRDFESISSFHDLYLKWEEHEEIFRGYNNADDLAQLILKDKFEEFEDSVRKNPDLASSMTSGKFTLLHLAVIRQRRRFVELLISMDQSLVNKRDRRTKVKSRSSHIPFAPPTIPHTHVKNATPLHYACLVQDMDIAEKLLGAGADWSVKDLKGRTPEELVRTVDKSCDDVKRTFVDLLNVESERRRKREEDGCNEDDEDDYTGPEGNEKIPVSDSKIVEEDPYMHVYKRDGFPSKASIGSLLSLEDKIGDKIVGQRGPIAIVANAIRLHESGWGDPDKPLTMLFLGSSGVGKTELAKQIALHLHGKNGLTTDNIVNVEKAHGFIRIDMSEFQGQHTVLNLIGSPKSYIGYGDGGALTQPLKKNPKAVVLLDEIEKAHPDVLNTFLQVFDDGRITDSKDGTIFCKDAIFIMTSNIGAEEIKDAAPTLRQGIAQSEKEGRPESYIHLIRNFTRSIRPQLKHHLKRDEFVGRINEIVVFLPLSQEEIEIAVHRELETWRKRAEEEHQIGLTWTDDVVKKLARSYDVNYGVRSIANEVQRVAVQLIADAYIRARIADNWEVELAVNEVGDISMSSYAPPALEPSEPDWSDY